jgi:hypothetical protein
MVGDGGDDLGLVIGIERYPYLRSLEAPRRDAARFASWLVDEAGVPDTQVECVLTREPPAPGERPDRPVQDDIDDAFRRLQDAARQLVARGRRPRRLYVYFAGHGCSSIFGHLVLVMANASLEELGRSLDTESYQSGLLRQALFPEQFFFYDCCRNYDNRVVGRIAPWSISDPPRGVKVKQFILYAAGFTEYAFEREVSSDLSGLFTEALLAGLKGAAAQWSETTRGWVVTTSSLIRFAQARLDELASQKRLRQRLTPHINGDTEWDIVVVSEPPYQMIAIPPVPNGAKIVVKNIKRQCFEPAQIVTGDPAMLRLPPGWYKIVVEPGGPVYTAEVTPGQEPKVEMMHLVKQNKYIMCSNA